VDLRKGSEGLIKDEGNVIEQQIDELYEKLKIDTVYVSTGIRLRELFTHTELPLRDCHDRQGSARCT
jgi:hypothetical protein